MSVIVTCFAPNAFHQKDFYISISGSIMGDVFRNIYIVNQCFSSKKCSDAGGPNEIRHKNDQSSE